MNQDRAYIGLDVHKEQIAVAVAVGRAAPVFQGVISNRAEAVRKWVQRIQRQYGAIEVAYEAGPTGFVLYWQLEHLGVTCLVAAPSLIPHPPGHRVKTDRRDALMLARLLRSGDLTSVWVPDRELEAFRDVVRAREAALADRLRATNRLRKLLLRAGVYPPARMGSASRAYQRWLASVHLATPAQQFVLDETRRAIAECQAHVERFEAEVRRLSATERFAPLLAAYQVLRGIGPLTAASLVGELGDVRRFRTARSLMSYTGLVPSEYSSGEAQHRGAITKAGNAHLRRVLVEAAWHARHEPRVGPGLKRRQAGQAAAIIAIGWKAQKRLHRRYKTLLGRTHNAPKTVSAVARELVGFVWAIAHAVPPLEPSTQALVAAA